MNSVALEYFSKLLQYPGKEYSRAQTITQALMTRLEEVEVDAEIMDAVKLFYDRIKTASLNSMEELYTSTFELNSVLPLYAGFLLFGESYKRGALLVELKRKLEEYQIPIHSEVPDFIPTLLQLLAKLEVDSEDAQELKNLCLFPAMQKLVGEIKNHENPYAPLLVAVKNYLAPKENIL